MATLTQGSILTTIGSTVYWQAAPAIFHGFVSNTDCSLIMVPDQRTVLVVPTSSVTTTATG